jgi:DnaJ-class molecular chaperone
MAKRDYYQVLGVSRDASDQQIKAAYRKAARKYHPDVNKSAEAGARFREATEAYDVLSDKEKRRMYDQYGHAGPSGAAGGGPWGPAGGRQGSGGVSFEEIFGGMGGAGGFGGMSLEEILEQLGGQARRGARRPPQRGRDAETELTLDFVDAARGVTRSLRLSGPSGTQTINVKIPPGVGDGSRVRIRGKGEAGAAGAGDLYIVVHVNPHAYFRREGDDVYVDLPVSIVEATLGARVDVPTIDGMTTVTVPPASSSGRKLRLRGAGIAAAGGARGDQYVVIKVIVPPSVSEKGRKLLQSFAESEPYDPRRDAGWR